MKIKNEYIRIKTKENDIFLRNMIFDNYLKYFFQRQYKEESLLYYENNVSMEKCFIKFDDPLENITQSNKDSDGNLIITPENFDISIELSSTSKIGNQTSASIVYNYSSKEGLTVYNSESETTPILNDFVDKKIVALGFGNQEIFACVDTSNYSISIIKDEELNISRKDIFKSDATCVNKDYPIHLMPIGEVYEYDTDKYAHICSKLYSVGLAKTPNFIDEEFLIGENINIIEESDTSFGFNLEKGSYSNTYPRNDIYLSDGLYPIPLFVESEIYPKEIYPGDDIYPGDSNYKYIVYKYRLCYISDENTVIYLDDFYNMVYPNSTKGLFEIITKVNRM